MGRPTGLITATTALVLWLAFCLSAQPPRIEEALRARSVQALAPADLSGVGVDFDGRDATLTGTVTSPDLRVRAERLVGGVGGVRTVDNRLLVAAPETAPEEPVPPYLEIHLRADGVTLRGTLPSEERRRRLVDRAREIYGAEGVDERLAVDPRAEDGAALAAAAEVLETLARSEQALGARLEGDSLRLSGSVDSPEARRRVEEQAREAAPRIRLFFSTVEVTDTGERGTGEGKD